MENENAQGVIAQHRAPGHARDRFGLGNHDRAAIVGLLANAR